jgi:hypothetical protein
MQHVTPSTCAERVDQRRLNGLLRMLAKEADYRDRKAVADRARAEQLRLDFNHVLAGAAVGSADANADCARQLRALIASTERAVTC